MDYIAFDQNGLNRAIEMGCRVIALCDNTFELPSAEGITYIEIGDVKLAGSAAEEKSGAEICVPEEPADVKIPDELSLEAASERIRRVSDSRTSYSSSYRSVYRTSYSSSYRSVYRTSYSSSYRTSHGSVYSTSYVLSYRTSYRSVYRTSYRTSNGLGLLLSADYSLGSPIRILSSFSASAARKIPRRRLVLKERDVSFCYERRIKEISVNGYGIDLI